MGHHSNEEKDTPNRREPPNPPPLAAARGKKENFLPIHGSRPFPCRPQMIRSTPFYQNQGGKV